jgi:hypothetical protein
VLNPVCYGIISRHSPDDVLNTVCHGVISHHSPDVDVLNAVSWYNFPSLPWLPFVQPWSFWNLSTLINHKVI